MLNLTDMKFTCKKCANCCTFPKSSEKEIKITNTKSNKPSINLSPFNLKGLVLFPWEKEKLFSLSKKMGIEVKILPDNGFFNQKEKIIAIYFYLLNIEGECPFLNRSKTCRIYKNRPIICRAYPIVSAGNLKFTFPMFGNCPNIINPSKIKYLELARELSSIYGEIFEWASKFELLVYYWTLLLKNLGIWDKFLTEYKSKLSNFDKIDIIDYLTSRNKGELDNILLKIKEILDLNIKQRLDQTFISKI